MRKFSNIRSLNDISSIGLVSILGSAISGLFWIYLAGLLGAENYGELSYYISISSIATSIAFVLMPLSLICSIHFLQHPQVLLL